MTVKDTVDIFQGGAPYPCMYLRQRMIWGLTLGKLIHPIALCHTVRAVQIVCSVFIVPQLVTLNLMFRTCLLEEGRGGERERDPLCSEMQEGTFVNVPVSPRVGPGA